VAIEFIAPVSSTSFVTVSHTFKMRPSLVRRFILTRGSRPEVVIIFYDRCLQMAKLTE